MGIRIAQHESQKIFNSIDFDMDGKLSFPEVQADVKSTVNMSIDALLMEEQTRQAAAQAGQDKYGNSAMGSTSIPQQ
jgi:hypothetical protein